MERVQKSIILKDLEKKIVLLVGPRQAGKTWLARDIAKNFKQTLYLNYDQPKDRSLIENQSWLPTIELLILDELHKMPDWKNYLKGVYDTKPATMRLLVTGSARLDVYDRIGDSLAGRYFRHHLLPISAAEEFQIKSTVSIDRLMERGGYPEPFLAENLVDAERWRTQYISSMLSTDVFDIDVLQNLKALHMLVELLQHRVGSPISMLSLARDVGVSPTTIKKYIQTLEALFIVFSITPYSHNIARSLLKEPKIYFYDTGMVEGDGGAKFENLVAISLLKHCYSLVDMTGQDYKVQYLRTKEGQEVDFAVIKKGQIESMIEAKLSDTTPSKSLLHFQRLYGYEAVQLVKNGRHSYKDKNVTIHKAEDYLKSLYL